MRRQARRCGEMLEEMQRERWRRRPIQKTSSWGKFKEGRGLPKTS